mgnify:CR=1 FL=1
MELIDGVKLKNMDKVKKLGYGLKKLAYTGFEAVFYQVFDLGLIHGDPHPGNLLATENNKLYFIDFGIVGYIDLTLQNNLLKAIVALVNKDIKAAILVSGLLSPLKAS